MAPATPADAVAALADPEAEVRAKLRRRFEVWLDEALAEENPPAGLDAELLGQLKGDDAAPPPASASCRNGDEFAPVRPLAEPGAPAECDLYSLWSALTGLGGEIKLQGRAFKQLADALAPVGALVQKTDSALVAHGEILAAHREALGAASAIAQDARNIRQDRDEEIRRTAHQAAHQSAEREFLELLLDLRDRMARGLQSAREQLAEVARLDGAGWFRGLIGRGRQVRRLTGGVEALVKGCHLSLDRLSDALGRLGVSEIDCAGRPLDPEQMRVVDVAEDAAAPLGTVLAVYRAGYLRNGQVVRLAEVQVAR